MATEIESKGQAAKDAARRLAFLSTDIKNKALLNIAEALGKRGTASPPVAF